MNSSAKAAFMTKDETMLLLQLVAANSIINNKTTNATNNKLKEEAWKTVASHFNSTSNFKRTPAQLRLRWDNLKKSARKRCAIMRRSHIKTGGSKDYFPPDEVLDKVTSLLGSSSQGFSVESGEDGDDSIPSTSDIIVGDNMNVKVEGQVNINDNHNGDSICGGDADEGEVLKETQIFETSPSKHNNRASGSSTLAKRKLKIQENLAKARINRENVLADYLLAKKKKLDREDEGQDLINAKLKLELENARIENELLKNLIAKKKELDREDEGKDLTIAKLKLELENARLQNELLKNLD